MAPYLDNPSEKAIYISESSQINRQHETIKSSAKQFLHHIGYLQNIDQKMNFLRLCRNWY